MFFPSDEIAKRLECPLCNARYDVPKILPCGNTICSGCESKLTKWDDRTYECSICRDVHLMPTSGWSINHFVENLLNLQPVDVYRGSSYEHAKNLLKKIDSIYHSLNHDLENCYMKIQIHCELLRDEIDVATESRLTAINKQRDELINRVNDYETKCFDNCKKENDFINKTRFLLETINDKINEWKMQLTKADLNEKQIEKIQIDMKLLEIQLNDNSKLLNKHVFCDSELNFIENDEPVKSIDIGILSKYINSTILNVNRLKSYEYQPLEINYKIETNIIYLFNTLAAYQHDKIVLASIVESTDNYYDLNLVFFIKIKLFNKQAGILLSEINQSIVKQNFISLATTSDYIIVVYQDANNYILNEYNEQLDLIKSIVIADYTIKSIESNRNLIYLISNSLNLSQIHVYDENLTEIETFGQNYDINSPFYIENFLHISFKDAYIYLFKNNQSIEILNRNTGQLENKIDLKQLHSISNYLFQADSNMTFVLISPKNKTLQIYDFNGQIIYEFILQNVQNISKFVVANDGSLIILDDILHKIYVI